MSPADRDAFLDLYISEPVHEIECPRCSRMSSLVDDCVYCGGVWMIPLARIKPDWIERELCAASAGDWPEWLRNGIYHLVDPCSGDIDRWLVCDVGVWYVSAEDYYLAWHRRKIAREESAVMKFAKKIFGGEKNDG